MKHYMNGYLLNNVKNTSLDPIQFYDRVQVLDGCELDPWVVFHAPLNWEYVPLKHRSLYAQRYMYRVRKAGWFIFDESLDNAKNFLNIIDTVYIRAEVIKFKQFVAIRFIPK